jgi:hypothetical protein
VAQVVGHVQGGGVAIRCFFGERLEADAFQLPGDGVVDLARRAGLVGDHAGQDLLAGVAVERPAAREQLIQHRAQAEHVGPAIDPVPLAVGLLRTHVCRRAAQSGAFAVIFPP